MAGRVRLAQVLAFVALVAALIGALGPARDVRSTYSWPPSTLPEASPSSAWYTPLLLIRHRPEAISASVPCTLPRALADAEAPAVVLATARFPERNGGFWLTREGGEYVIRFGDGVLGRVPPSGDSGPSCAYRVGLGGGRWSLVGPAGDVLQSGSLATMPVVTGLFSELDLRTGPRPSVEVTTAVHATHARPHQKVAWALAVLCAVAALALVALERPPRPRLSPRRIVGHARPADAVVGIVLVGWWVLSPAFHDDGWVIARESMFSSSGGFPSYYNAFGTNYPNDYWLEWTQHWLVDATSALTWLRLPSLLCLAAVWVLCRWILARVLASPAGAGGSTVALWTLTGVFLAGALAWGMTLRPEPVSALFVTAVFACTVRFLERGTTAPVALAALLLPLALTGHHAAVVAFAPLLVASPAILRWARARIPVASTIVSSSIALFAVLLFVGADLEQRRADAGTLATHTGVSWRSEILRYEAFSGFPFATPLRRASIALIALAVLAFLLRRRRERQLLLDLPAASLGLGLVLLIPSPSKFPWHFGALLGIAALAAAAEATRLRRDAEPGAGWSARPFVALGAACLAAAWAWSPRDGLSTLDLRTYTWAPDAPLATLGILALVAILGGALLLARRRGDRLPDVPWRVASWAAIVLVGPMLLFTVAVLAADAAKTDGWTLTRQNLGAFGGDAGCGLADDLLVPAAGTLRPLDGTAAGRGAAVPPWVPPPPLDAVSRFVLGPAQTTQIASPWFELRDDAPLGLYVAGTPNPTDRLELEWGRRRGSEVDGIQTDQVSMRPFSGAGAALPWRFVSANELPTPAEGADAVRVTLSGGTGPSAAVAVATPVTYANEPLARRLASPSSRPLVFPNLVTYFPCAELPHFASGAAEAPRQIVIPSDAGSPVREPATSPFAGVLDLYQLERLPLADSGNPPDDFIVFDVAGDIPGAVEAAPTVTTSIAG